MDRVRKERLFAKLAVRLPSAIRKEIRENGVAAAKQRFPSMKNQISHALDNKEVGAKIKREAARVRQQGRKYNEERAQTQPGWGNKKADKHWRFMRNSEERLIKRTSKLRKMLGRPERKHRIDGFDDSTGNPKFYLKGHEEWERRVYNQGLSPGKITLRRLRKKAKIRGRSK